jgi:hypothetical protein
MEFSFFIDVIELYTTFLLEEASFKAVFYKTEITAVWDPLHRPCATTLYPQKLTLTSTTSGDRSVGIVRSRTKATELVNSVRSETNRISFPMKI